MKVGWEKWNVEEVKPVEAQVRGASNRGLPVLGHSFREADF